MNCLICGRTTLPGAKLCADCRSARKRAFAATVTQPLLAAAGVRSGARLLKPSQSVAATARRAAERALFAKPPPAKPAKAPARRTDLMLLVAAIGTILVVSAFAGHRLNVAKLESSQAGESSAPQGDKSGAVAAAQPTPLADLTARAVAEMRAAAAAPASTEKVDAPKRAVARQRIPPAEVPPPVEPAPAAQTLAVAPAAAPAVVREAPPPDPLQVMNQNLAQCANGDLIDRIFCDQRVRRQFCDGQWGKVPQCQSSVPNDHGQ